MDGNGRWAETRGRPRAEGHRAGAEAIRGVLAASIEAGVSYLTLYAFSTENWGRPSEEVAALMELFREMVLREIDELDERGVRLRVLGRLEELPEATRQAFAEAERRTESNEGIQMILALNYGSRLEMADAARAIAREVARGARRPEDVDEETFSGHLYLPGLPDADLLIRSGGECRVSNFLLWQIAYAEIFVTKKLWPDFGRADLFEALGEFQRRERRFGRVGDDI
ncbi:MAG: di-trans,poly-cis-decaprenylcistransferase [Actinobacteria bacterium]|nr:MAG: di-trans,poly-cis-decaprenylcistransferase [Actinomycetota bacterium]